MKWSLIDGTRVTISSSRLRQMISAGRRAQLIEHDVGAEAAVVEIVGHRQRRRDAGARRDEQVLAVAAHRDREDPRWTPRPDLHADLEVVEHPARADAVRAGLDGQPEGQRPRGRRRDRVGPPDRAARDGQLEGDELAGPEAEPAAVRRDEADRRDVGRLGDDGAALERLGVGPDRGLVEAGERCAHRGHSAATRARSAKERPSVSTYQSTNWITPLSCTLE